MSVDATVVQMGRLEFIFEIGALFSCPWIFGGFNISQFSVFRL